MPSDPRSLSLLAVLSLDVLLALSLVVFLARRAFSETPRPREAGEGRTSRLLSGLLREYWLWLVGPLERSLLACGATPNLITSVGLLLAICTGVLYSVGYVGPAGWVLIASGTCDILDGRVARAGRLETHSGAFYDSVMDRLGDIGIFVGVTVYFRDSWMFYVSLGALTGSLMVSYVRSRAEAAGVRCAVGLMHRPERVFVLAAVSITDPLLGNPTIVGSPSDADYLLKGGVAAVSLLSWHTAFRRLMHGYRTIASGEADPSSSARD